MMGHQVFVRKKPSFDVLGSAMSEKISQFVHIDIGCVVYALYEVEGLSQQDLLRFQNGILGDPITDELCHSIDTDGRSVLVYTFGAGQFDQRSYYATMAGKLVLDHSENFTVRSSTVIVFDRLLDEDEEKRISDYLINPVDTRKRTLEYEKPPKPIRRKMRDIVGFTNLDEVGLKKLRSDMGLTMEGDTLRYIQHHYRTIGRQPTETELVLFDTYWSDHCRHTTFLTRLEHVTFSGRYKREIEASFRKYLSQRDEIGRTGAITLMDLATHSQRYMRAKGTLSKVEISQEVNACSVEVSDQHGDYLLMFKNETHNHPTEIEPFGGAQTCLGGAIRDPLSGRSFVFQGIRISGAGDPTVDVSQTLPNKLPQSTIVRDSARGFSSYGNQIGMATTMVKEFYHPSYVAKHLELGAVVGITKRDEVVRGIPQPGDVVVLLGGKTGKDGIGGASGSSVAHTSQSLDTSYAQIQKGNPLEERKLQRLFKKAEVKRMIKRCNDFGAGGVSVAIGELAPGLVIELDKVPLKAHGMNPTEMAISESQERMAVVIDEEDLELLCSYAALENVEATAVAVVTNDNHLVMRYRKERIVDIDRDFLDTNGPLPSIGVEVDDPRPTQYDRAHFLALNRYSQKGLGEIFDSSVGNSTLFSPYGGITRTTPELSSVQRFPLHGNSDKASVVSYGFDPTIGESSPYVMGMCSVLSSVAKQVAVGARLEDIHLSLQEYFPKPADDPKKWGLVLQALLGAFETCDQLSLAAIGGKDSMSGTYENLDVVPTLVSFAFGEVEISRLRSRAFKSPGEFIYVLRQETPSNLPDVSSFKQNLALLEKYRDEITAISTLDEGLSHTLDLMAIGNMVGYDCPEVDNCNNPGGFVFTTKRKLAGLEQVGMTVQRFDRSFLDSHLNGLSKVHPMVRMGTGSLPDKVPIHEKRYYHTKVDAPVVLILTFSGTNSELDMEMNFSRAGGRTKVFVVNDTSHKVFEQSVASFISELQSAHILVIPGGFSFSDEPDGSGKFIATFLGIPKVGAAIESFVADDRLVLGICNGFQGLVKSGLLPYGKVTERKASDPTLFFNDSYRHVATLVETRIRSLRSPWLQDLDPHLSYLLPVSHSEGKFVASDALLHHLLAHDQIATIYVDNPNGSSMDIEGIISENGNILGKMAHNERISNDLFVNVEGNRRQDIFASGIRYFTNGGK
jgi:phosphoribosylformylglycinamidine synthase